MVVNVNHVAKVVIVLLPWLLLLVIFALGVGLLILEVSDVVNAKVGNMVLLMVTTHVYAKIAKKEDILALTMITVNVLIVLADIILTKQNKDFVLHATLVNIPTQLVCIYVKIVQKENFKMNVHQQNVKRVTMLNLYQMI